MPPTIDAAHAIAHNKIIIIDIIDIIDEEMVITGSFNFTKAAQEKNAENLLIIRDPELAAQYTQNWQAHAPHSQPYVGRGVQRNGGAGGERDMRTIGGLHNRRVADWWHPVGRLEASISDTRGEPEHPEGYQWGAISHY